MSEPRTEPIPHSLLPIGFMRTCFTEKFGAPRQSGMATEAHGVLKLKPVPSFRDALNHLDRFSHVWVIYLFHRHVDEAWTPTIVPPRLGGPKRVGVFASRSPHRPNPIGLSALKLERIDLEAPGGIEIHLSGVDILDGTPVLDVKPYLPFADRVEEANAGWAAGDIPRYPVTYSDEALAAFSDPECQARHPRFRQLVTELLEWDPRPLSQRKAMPIESPATDGKAFAFRLLGCDVRWEARNGGIRVLNLIRDRSPE